MKKLIPLFIGLVSIALGAVVIFYPPIEGAMQLVKDVGVWVIWGILLLLGYGMYRALPRLREDPWLNWPALGIALAISVLMHVHYPHQFKILADELVLVGVSKSIHEERVVTVPSTLQDIHGAVKIGHGYLDKRPYLYSFTVALLHDLTGYRPQNAFILNGILTPVLLYLVFLVTWRVTAQPKAGWVAMGMVAAVPIFAHNVTGGGFEILNACLILFLFLYAWRYARGDAPELQLGLVAIGLLTAYTRYESAIYLVGVVLIVGLVNLAQRRFHLDVFVTLSPILAIPLVAIFRVVTTFQERWFQLSDKGSTEAFSIDFLPANLIPALMFFFSDDHVQMGSLWISTVCSFGILFGLLALSRALRERFTARSYWAPAVVPLVVLANFILLLSYHWGQLSDPLVSRLAIPFILLAIVLTCWTATRAVHTRRLLIGLAGVSAVAFYASAIPTATKHSFAQAYGPARELESIDDFVRDHYHPDMLVLTDRQFAWVVRNIWTEEIRATQYARTLVERWIHSGRYAKVFAQQRHSVDPTTGRMTVKSGYELPKEWEVREVMRRRLTDEEVMTITEVVRVPDTLAAAPYALEKGEAGADGDPEKAPTMEETGATEKSESQLPDPSPAPAPGA